MDNIIKFETINDYNAFNNNETLHPLVSVVDLSKAEPRQGSRMYFGFYTIFLKDVKCGDLVYGRHTYDSQEGTLVFLARGKLQVLIATAKLISRRVMRWFSILI